MKEFAVKVENKDQYDELMRACEENGYKWSGELIAKCSTLKYYCFIIIYPQTKTLAWDYASNPNHYNEFATFHLAMSYIYGDYKFHYGARVWTENDGCGTIIARDSTKPYYYTIKFDTPSRGLHDGSEPACSWGHGSDKDDCWWVRARDIKFTAPEEDTVKLAVGEKEYTLYCSGDVRLHDTLAKKHSCYTAIRNHNTVVVILEDGRKGFAVCSPRDEFNFQKGFEIAYKRAVKNDSQL